MVNLWVREVPVCLRGICAVAFRRSMVVTLFAQTAPLGRVCRCRCRYRCCCRVAMEQGSRRSSFWLKAGEQAHFAISIPVLRRCSLVLVLERLSPAGEPLLLLRHEAAPRVEAWERRRASVLTVEADAWDHEGFHRGDPQARLRCADLAAGLWVVGAFNYSEVQLIPWP